DVPGLALGRLLPGGRRRQAGDLAGQLDTGQFAEAELLGPLGDPLAAEAGPFAARLAAAERVEVGVARVGERRDHVLRPVRRPAGAAGAVRQADAAAAVDDGVRLHDAGLQRGQRRDHLEARAGRPGRRDAAVQHRTVFVRHQSRKLVLADRQQKKTVVVQGQVHHREDLAGVRVERDRRGDLELVELLRQDPVDLALQRQVDRELDVAPGPWGVEGDDADLASGRVDLGLLLARYAAQLGLERRLDAVLADAVERRVRAVRAARGFELVLGDLAQVAEDVAGEGAIRVLPQRLGRDDHAGQLEVALLDRLGRGRVGRLLQRNGGERVAAPPCDRAGERLGAAADQLREPPVDDLRPAGQVGRQDGHRERRPVAHHRDAVAVVDQPPLGRHGDDTQPVVVGFDALGGALEDLELKQPRTEREHPKGAHRAHLEDAPPRVELDRWWGGVLEGAEELHAPRFYRRNASPARRAAPYRPFLAAA